MICSFRLLILSLLTAATVQAQPLHILLQDVQQSVDQFQLHALDRSTGSSALLGQFAIPNHDPGVSAPARHRNGDIEFISAVNIGRTLEAIRLGQSGRVISRDSITPGAWSNGSFQLSDVLIERSSGDLIFLVITRGSVHELRIERFNRVLQATQTEAVIQVPGLYIAEATFDATQSWLYILTDNQNFSERGFYQVDLSDPRLLPQLVQAVPFITARLSIQEMGGIAGIGLFLLRYQGQFIPVGLAPGAPPIVGRDIYSNQLFAPQAASGFSLSTGLMSFIFARPNGTSPLELIEFDFPNGGVFHQRATTLVSSQHRVHWIVAD